MKVTCYALTLAALVLLLSACATDEPNPVDRLPPATQTGANTFGCLVNGQPWTPKGNASYPNYTLSYDEFPDGGLLQVNAYRLLGQGAADFETISLWTKRISGIGTFSFQNTATSIASFDNRKRNCYWSSSDSTTTYRWGLFTITRLDLQVGIVSGTFAFTMYKPGCDSVHVTDGRFDYKL